MATGRDLYLQSATGKPEDAPNVPHRGLYRALRRVVLCKIQFHDRTDTQCR
jgi:hypothetical protein